MKSYVLYGWEDRDEEEDEKKSIFNSRKKNLKNHYYYYLFLALTHSGFFGVWNCVRNCT